MRTLAALFLLFTLVTSSADPLERGFAKPPESTQPWVYWYWITDNISREGITKDLEAMKRVGIKEAFIGNIYLEEVKHGKVKALTEEWWGMVEHAIREGGRVGVDIGMFNCPGWSQSGGPWIKPEQAMRYVVSTETKLRGPSHFIGRLPAGGGNFQPIAVLAFPAPQQDGEVISRHEPQVSCEPAAENALRLTDGDTSTAVMLPNGAGQGTTAFVVDLKVSQPFTARSLVLYPAKVPFAAECELLTVDDSGKARSLRRFPVDRSNTNLHVGPMPFGPVAISFPAETSQHFRLVLSKVSGAGGIAEVELSGAARVERYVEKQLGKMHPTPLPMWDTYLWPASAEPTGVDFAVAPGSVIDLSGKVGTDGSLNWEVPAGDWIVLRTGMTPTGTRNSPASPEGQGLEVDKMNRAAAQAHFDAFIGKLLQRMPKSERKAFKHVVADSYEMGSQDWTDGFGKLFEQRYSYDPRPWLPVLSGRLVGNADQSDRFLWDLRRLVADHISTDYVGGLRDACHKHGLKLWLENYGHWGYPAEFLQYGGQSDELSGEFWATGDLGSIELRCASSAAHIYGKPIVHAEAFTSGVLFQSTPWSLKRRGDWALTEGINHWVLHVYVHQPWEDRRPGVNAWFSTEFNRHNTWFEQSRAWIDYYRRCNFLLQQGQHVADVAYFIGEDTPKMTGVRKPSLPAGYDFDYLNGEVIEQRLKVKKGRFVLPEGKSYQLLVLPEMDTMRPELLMRLRDLVNAGGAILGPPPSRSPSLQGYPVCDRRVQELAAQIWGLPDSSGTRTPAAELRVYRNSALQPVLDALAVLPDVAGIEPGKVAWTHRSSGEAEIYFLSNQSEQGVHLSPVFRVKGRMPELWNPVNGTVIATAVYEESGHGVRVPLDLGPRDSVFVVFRQRTGREPGVLRVKKDGVTIAGVVTQPGRNAEPAAVLPRIWLARDGKRLAAEVSAGGKYDLEWVGGRSQALLVDGVASPLLIDGPWRVQFPPRMDVPESIQLDKLGSLTDYPNEAVKYFSGTATYEKAFELPADRLGEGKRTWLDLGRVEAMADVTLNGRALGTFWKPPFVMDITEAATAGTNHLEVRVTGTWRNRLIGDAKYPNGLPGSSEAMGRQVQFQPYLGVDIRLNSAEAPAPFGLLGPACIRSTQRVTVKP